MLHTRRSLNLSCEENYYRSECLILPIWLVLFGKICDLDSHIVWIVIWYTRKTCIAFLQVHFPCTTSETCGAHNFHMRAQQIVLNKSKHGIIKKHACFSVASLFVDIEPAEYFTHFPINTGQIRKTKWYLSSAETMCLEIYFADKPDEWSIF